MITAFSLIRNTGRFDSVSTSGQLSFGKFALIYGENGRGKTTLSAILKSLSLNDPALILHRKRLGSVHPPHVVVKSAVGDHVFQNGQWAQHYPDIVVFDDDFVSDNVCSGISVDTEHCRNLHELILGSQGVQLNAAQQAEVTKVEQHNKDLKRLEAAIPAAVRGKLSVDKFCALEPNENIDVEITAAEKRLAAAKSSETIRKREAFQPFHLPAFDIEKLNSVLGRSLPDLEADAAAQVKRHLEQGGKEVEAWIAEGIKLIDDTASEDQDCPFCGQHLSGSTLIAHYQAYFSDAYTDLKSLITETGKAINRDFGEAIPAAFERSVRRIIEAREFWSSFTEVPEIEVDTASIVRTMNNAREQVRACFVEKFTTPLEATLLSEDALAAIDAYTKAVASLDPVLRTISKANESVALVKEQSASADIVTLEADLALLKAVKSRHNEPLASACEEYLAEAAAKKATEKRRDEARAKLRKYQEEVFPKYQDDINRFLNRFNAGYRIGSVGSRNTRGGSLCDYKVLINNEEVALTSTDGPSFKTSLSAGDRNTLALAFFFASLEQDTGLLQKTIVIDDPMTSLDEHRSLTTRQEMKKLAQRVAQVIILSHEKPFLCSLWEAADKVERSAVQVVRDGDGSSIVNWDVHRDSITEHDKRHELVLRYLERSSPDDERETAVALRFILEAFLRVAYPAEFRPGDLIGPFLNTCEQKLGTTTEILSQLEVSELRDVLDYANKFHHDTNPAYETEAINDGELRQFAERALAFASRRPLAV